jgi:FkbM family methyltransferase
MNGSGKPAAASASRKPNHPYPAWMRRVLRKVLPQRIFRRYVGRHEDESMRKWRRMAAHVPAGKAVLDIGAFEGEYALAARAVNPDVAVYAFEPNPETATALRHACEEHAIDVVAAAVSDQPGVVSLASRSAESAIVDADESAALGDEIVTVPAISLDDWLSEHAVVPDLIKIDVEGAEVRTLNGAARSLAEHRPIILCEILSDEAGSAVGRSLPPHYRFFRVDENGGVTEHSTITRREWRNKNWIFAPQERRVEVMGGRTGAD